MINPSSLLDQDEQVIIDSSFDSLQDKGLFGETVMSMQQASDVGKKQGEAFDLCVPCGPLLPSGCFKEPKFKSLKQSTCQMHGSQGQRQWGKKYFAVATATSTAVSSRSSHQEGKKRRPT